MGHYCGFGPSVGLSEKSSYTSSFPQFIGTNGTSNNWDYSGWHNNAYSGCHQQVYPAGISPWSGYNYVQRSCGNASVESNDSDRTYWKVHAYQVPDDVQETCSTSFRTSDASDDCYWSVCTFPVSSTEPHVTQTQPSLHDGTVGYSLKVPSKAEYHEMPVPKVSNPIPIENTLERVPPEQQSQLCEKKERSLEQQTFLKQKYDEAQDNLNQSEECHERSNEKDIHTLCRKLLADLKHIQEERKTRELEAQRKHEEQEIHKELEHFLYNAFNLFEEEQQESEHAPKCFSKPIFSPARPTVGVCSLTNEKNPIMKGFPCVLTRRRTIHLSIKHTNEKSTQAASMLCVQEATVHCADKSSEINIKKQYVLINKHDITHPVDLNNDKEVRFTLQYQLPLSSAPCIWDPGIDLFSHKKLHIFPWIPHSTIIILQQEHFFFLEKGRQVQWDSGIQVIDDGITSNSTWTIRDAEWLKITEDCFAEQDLMANTSSKMTAFTWHISITETSFILLRNTTYTFDPGVLKIKYTILDKWAVPHQVQFVQHTFELSLLILEAFVQYYAPNGVNSVLNGTSYMLQRDTHSSQDNYFCSLHYKIEYCQMKWLWEYSISSAIRVQWGLGVKMSLYGWMDIFILRSETDKPLSCTHIPDLTAWQHQSGGISASYVWEPGTILWPSHYTENIMCYFTTSSVLEEKEMLSFVHSTAMKQIPAMILPGILGHVISRLICRMIKFCSACFFSPCHHALSLTESQVDLAHIFYLLQPAHITCYTPQLSTLLHNTIPSLTWDPESLAYRPEAIQCSIVLEDDSSKLAAQVQRIVELVVEDLMSRCLIIPSHHLSRAWRTLKRENLQTINMAWVMELWIVTFLPP